MRAGAISNELFTNRLLTFISQSLNDESVTIDWCSAIKQRTNTVFRLFNELNYLYLAGPFIVFNVF